MAKKPWQKRLLKALKLLKRSKPVVEQEPESRRERNLSSAKLVSFYSAMGGKGNALPLLGEALYYVVGLDRKKNAIEVLHPYYLETAKIPRRDFESNIVSCWWPITTGTGGASCNKDKVADQMLKRMQYLASRGKRYPERIVREAIATLKEVDVSYIPEYLEPTALEVYHKQRKEELENMATFQKRAAKVLKDWDKMGKKSKKSNNEPEEEKETKKMKKAAKKSAKKAAKVENKKAEKTVKRAAKKAPKEKAAKKEKKVRIPGGAKGAIITLLMKSKKASNDSLKAAIQKAKKTKKEISDKKLKSTAKNCEKFFKKHEMKLVATKTGYEVKAA